MLQPFVLMQSHLLLYRHGFYDVSVTLCEVIITLSKYTRDIHLRSDSTELDEAVPIEVKFWHDPHLMPHCFYECGKVFVENVCLLKMSTKFLCTD